MSELDKVIEEKVVEEMEKTEVHPRDFRQELEFRTDQIEDVLQNVNTDEEIENILDMLSELTDMASRQENFYNSARSEEQAHMHGTGKATPGSIPSSHINVRSTHQPVDSGKLKSRMEDLTEKYNQNNNE